MKQYFEDFEAKLQVTEEKLDILSEWHIAKGHNGASGIAEECRTAISNLWIEFYRLSERYKKTEASHEQVVQSNLDNLLGEMKRYDDECTERYEKAPDWLLFNFLDKAIKENNLSNGIIDSTVSTWTYLRSLIYKDLKERGLV
ncbi:hypothetical protein AB7939_00900 [Streptococcus pyogenes]|uniref:Phage protein n=1 Tax=Streptococcus dysgalactiae TaxID=1334 RepID=A0ABU0A8Q6_STRDY|nr:MULTISPECIES: hypothetical protein [Streptococcus]EGL47676.1 hypothetical protein HMPREF9964_1579 [Streptococcus dysgalactiae subsp. equisimilis SK1249]MDQ0263662.1 hypothetical protein [Streptococcus dysgalactiae]QQC55320.1 hypothetical protein I6H73_10625 [Streptococcus dysgalactiae]TYL00357.1 hypothetical protein E0F70_10535 [Streptococcus dysgalactiae]SQG29193.1 Uncharacterised protein [Streptococcus pyogenes]